MSSEDWRRPAPPLNFVNMRSEFTEPPNSFPLQLPTFPFPSSSYGPDGVGAGTAEKVGKEARRKRVVEEARRLQVLSSSSLLSLQFLAGP